MSTINYQSNEQAVKETLDLSLGILQELNVQYLFLGSVVLSAINGEQHRRLGDLDIVVGREQHPELKNRLLSSGYTEAKGMFGFARKYLSIETLIHPTLVSIGYFYGTWQEDGSFVIGGNASHLLVEKKALVPTKYSLHGFSFLGFPPGAIANGVYCSKHNSKRRREIEILSNKNISPMTNDYIHVKIFGMPCDFFYHFSMFLLNILGFIREQCGLPFDPWRSKIQ